MTMPKQDVVAVPAARPQERFLSLGSRFAGEPMRKPAAVGDVSSCPVAGSAPRALADASNRSDRGWFVPEIDALDARPGARPS
ncbi:hypothetical protein [Streptosporangium sp. V21-05]|uniref:hypothetical protein n=1 Tax=Streptosporangium sp. V21-05 TaxID=3446115 RepID=UPI003F533DC8